MNIVDAVFNRIPNIVWVNMAKSLMQEICDSIINSLDSEDPCKERHSKAVILSVFEDFLKNNFSVENTAILTDRFKSDFLNFVMKNAKHPMDSFFQYNYINLLVLKKILDTDANLSNSGKLLLNVLQPAIEEVQRTNNKDTPRNKARKVIQLIKDQLKPTNPKPVSQGGGRICPDNLELVKELNDALHLLSEMNTDIAYKHKPKFDEISNKLTTIRDYMLEGKSGGSPPPGFPGLNKALTSAVTTGLPDAKSLTAGLPDTNAFTSAVTTGLPDAKSLTAGLPDTNALTAAATAGLPDPNKAIAELNSNITGQVSNIQEEANRKLQEAQDKVLKDAQDKALKEGQAFLENATGELAGKGQELLGKAMGTLENTPIGAALGSLKEKGFDLPTPGNLSAKIVDEIFNNFSKTSKKGYEEIREDMYKRFIDTINDHLHAPEGRQMYLRVIDPFLTKCIEEVIDSGIVAVATLIHLVTKVTDVREMVESALVSGFEKIADGTIIEGFGNLDPLEGTLFTEYVINEHISMKVSKLLETQNPLNKLYTNMKTMEYDEEVIKQKQANDYKKTLCSPYAPIVSEPVIAQPIPIAPVIRSSAPSAITSILANTAQNAIQNGLNDFSGKLLPGITPSAPPATPVVEPSALPATPVVEPSAPTINEIQENDTEIAIKNSLDNNSVIPESLEIKPNEQLSEVSEKEEAKEAEVVVNLPKDDEKPIKGGWKQNKTMKKLSNMQSKSKKTRYNR